jgi:hypothetical protein
MAGTGFETAVHRFGGENIYLKIGIDTGHAPEICWLLRL